MPVLLSRISLFFFFNDTATTEIYTLSLHDALPISVPARLPRLDPSDRRDPHRRLRPVHRRRAPSRDLRAHSAVAAPGEADRESTPLDSSHDQISYAGVRLEKKNCCA